MRSELVTDFMNLDYFRATSVYQEFTYTFNGRDILVVWNRTERPVNGNLEIMPGMVVVREISDDEVEALWEMVLNGEDHVANPMTFVSFLENMPPVQVEINMTFEIKVRNYLRFVNRVAYAGDVYELIESRVKTEYIPTRSEVLFFSKENLDLVDMSEMVYLEKEITWGEEVRFKMMELVRVTAAKRDENSTMTEVEWRTFITDLTEKDEVTLAEVKNYVFNRHEMFAKVFMEQLGTAFARTDVKLEEAFSDVDMTKVNGSLTPDVIRVDNRTADILEFTVTDTNTLTKANEKLRKYQGMVNFINTTSDWSVTLTVVVMNLDTRTVDVFSQDEELKALSLENISAVNAYTKSLFDVIQVVEAIPNYRMMKMIMDETSNNVSTNESVMKVVEDLNMMLLRETNHPVVTPYRVSFDPKLMNSVIEVLSTTKEVASVAAMANPLYMTGEDASVEAMASRFKEAWKMERFTYEVDTMMEIKKADIISIYETKLKEFNSGRLVPNKAPKMFPFPRFMETMKSVPVGMVTSLEVRVTLDDGTNLLKRVAPNFTKEKSTEYENKTISLNNLEAEMLKDNVMDLMAVDKVLDIKDVDIVSVFNNTKVARIMGMMEKVAREAMLMSERRFASRTIRSAAAFKEFEGFSLLMAASGKVKSDSQIFVKVYVLDLEDDAVEDMLFRSFTNEAANAECTDVKATGWLAFQLADLEHYTTLLGRARVIISDMWERTKSARVSYAMKNDLMNGYLPTIFMMPLATLMEHKRGTSTQHQVSRYLMHSMTSVLSMSNKIAEEIYDTPVRTLLHAMVVRNQTIWAIKMANDFTANQAILEGFAAESDDIKKDAFMLPSIHDPVTMVDFSVVMMEIYYTNLFNPYSGMNAHRQKMILDKTAKMEEKYKERILSADTKTMDELIFGPDEFFYYSQEAISEATKSWMENEDNKVFVAKAMTHALTTTVDKVVKMTRTLVGAPSSSTAVNFSTDMEKMTVLEGVLQEINSFETVKLLDIYNQMETFQVAFSTFSKAQLGPVREILIQSIRTRIITALFNSFFEFLCKYHVKEMITKEKAKKEIQSRTMMEYKELAARKVEEGYSAVAFSKNADSARWAPSQEMAQYGAMVKEMDLPKDFETLLVTVVTAYSNKTVFAPETVREKIKEWSDSLKETDDVMRRVCNLADSEGEMMIHSGMGQGNFQHASSFFHCLVDDYSDKILFKSLEDTSFKMRVTTLISSDDVCKMVVAWDTERRSEEEMSTVAFSMVLISSDVFNGVRKAANIHINWKKTAVQVLITEFNSVFSVKKRMYVASIKDAYTAVQVPDMTTPEGAVKEVISSVRRLLEAGCFMETIETAMRENRRLISAFYNMEEVKDTLMNILECTETELPFNLGFVPVTNVLEVLIYGPEVMIHTHNSPTLKAFYERIYSVNTLISDDVEADGEAPMSSIRFFVDKIPDKKLMEIKRLVSENLVAPMKANYEGMTELTLMDQTLSRFDLSVLKRTGIRAEYLMFLANYISSVNRNYGFTHSFRMNSMVRAMQYTKKILITRTSEAVPLTDAVRAVLDLKEFTSYITIFSELKAVVAESEIHKAKMTAMVYVSKDIHPKYRKLNFFRRNVYGVNMSDQIITAIFSKDPDIKTKEMATISIIAEAMAIPMNDLLKDPYTSVKAKFGRRAQEKFKVFVNRILSGYTVNVVSMVAIEATRNDRNMDMLMLKRTLSRAGYVMKDPDTAENDTITSKVLNTVAFADFPTVKEETAKISWSDTMSFSMSVLYTLGKAKMVRDVTVIDDARALEINPIYRRVSNTMFFVSGYGHYTAFYHKENPKCLVITKYGAPNALVRSMVLREVVKSSISGMVTSVSYKVRTVNGLETKTVMTRNVLASTFMDEMVAMHRAPTGIFLYRTETYWEIKLNVNSTILRWFRSAYTIDIYNLNSTPREEFLKKLMTQKVTLKMFQEAFNEFQETEYSMVDIYLTPDEIREMEAGNFIEAESTAMARAFEGVRTQNSRVLNEIDERIQAVDTSFGDEVSGSGAADTGLVTAVTAAARNTELAGMMAALRAEYDKEEVMGDSAENTTEATMLANYTSILLDYLRPMVVEEFTVNYSALAMTTTMNAKASVLYSYTRDLMYDYLRDVPNDYLVIYIVTIMMEAFTMRTRILPVTRMKNIIDVEDIDNIYVKMSEQVRERTQANTLDDMFN